MPTETAKPRLIDANALIVKINSDIDGESTMAKRALVRTVTELLDSATTVETTDDGWIPVEVRLPEPGDYKKFLVTYSNGSVSFARRSKYDDYRWRDCILDKLEKSM